MYQIIDGKKISAEIKIEIAKQVEEIILKGEKRPHLAAILVGGDGASETYVAHKVKACEQVGFKSTMVRFAEDISELELLSKIKHCVVLGRSNIVGKPISILMSQKAEFANATVTVCHSRTQNIKEITKQADILIVALGQQGFVTADMVKNGATVIDVGIHRVKSDKTKSGWKLLGDVKFDEVAEKCSYITPVPGGVGPMTIVSLLKNTLLAAQNKIEF